MWRGTQHDAGGVDPVAAGGAGGAADGDRGRVVRCAADNDTLWRVAGPCDGPEAAKATEAGVCSVAGAGRDQHAGKGGRALTGFLARGWAAFPFDAHIAGWLRHAGPAAIGAMQTTCGPPAGYDCGGTWFVGVDALPNDAAGTVAGSGPLRGDVIAFLRAYCGGALPALHRAQVSTIFPGYPRPREHEGEAAFRYRQRHDAAHVDGLLPAGPGRARMIREAHAFVLGLPLTDCDEKAGPMVVWEGSHRIMRQAFETALRPHPPEHWPDVDVTDAYRSARRQVFATCARIRMAARPGEAYILHRHALHGVAPWQEGASAPPEGRVIIYFRPECPGGVRDWLEKD